MPEYWLEGDKKPKKKKENDEGWFWQVFMSGLYIILNIIIYFIY